MNFDRTKYAARRKAAWAERLARTRNTTDCSGVLPPEPTPGKRALRRRRHLDMNHMGSGGERQSRSALQPGLQQTGHEHR